MILLRRLLFLFLILSVLNPWGIPAQARETLVLYSSMKEGLLEKLREGFIARNPEVDLDYFATGAGKLMTRILSERQSGKVSADVIWTSEILDLYRLKTEGVLERYVSPESKGIPGALKDHDGFFTPARLAAMGFAFHTRKVPDPPRSWQDLLDHRFKDGIGMPNPALSATACVSVALLTQHFGWDFIDQLKANGARMGQGLRQVLEDILCGDIKVSLAFDLLAFEKMEKGASLGFYYPEELVVIPSPIAVIKGTDHSRAAHKWVDFVLSREGQEIIAFSGALPVREDVPQVKRFVSISPRVAGKRAMKIDYVRLLREKESILQRFQAVMKRS